LETGLRMGELLGLTWEQVRLVERKAWLHADQTKARRARAVPLSECAVQVIRGQLGVHLTHVFSFRGKAMKRVNGRAWRECLGRAGIPDFRWHDLRHTWATRLAMSGASLSELQELGGWESPEMVRRYAHFSGGHLAEVQERASRSGVLQLAAA
jgi:integrase